MFMTAEAVISDWTVSLCAVCWAPQPLTMSMLSLESEHRGAKQLWREATTCRLCPQTWKRQTPSSIIGILTISLTMMIGACTKVTKVYFQNK
jgi:hypothetical protein